MNKRLYVLAGLIILLSGSALVWCEREPQAPAAAPIAEESAFVAATGRVEARRQAVVCAKGTGRVLEFLKKEGDWADKGQAVAVLDQAMEAAALREAEAEVFRAESRFRRVKVLHEQKVAADQEFEDADAAYRLALARRDEAAAALDERTLKAPFSGRILKTYIEAGESLQPGSPDAPVFVIGDTRALKVRAEVDEQDIGRLTLGSAAQVHADAFPEETFMGKVTEISGILGRKELHSDDPRERMDAKVLEVMVALASAQLLKPGITVEVKIDAAPSKDAL